MNGCIFRGNDSPIFNFGHFQLCHPSKMGTTFNGKNLPHKEQILSFKSCPHFGMVLQPEKQTGSQKLVSVYKCLYLRMADKICGCICIHHKSFCRFKDLPPIFG